MSNYMQQKTIDTITYSCPNAIDLSRQISDDVVLPTNCTTFFPAVASKKVNLSDQRDEIYVGSNQLFAGMFVWNDY